MNDQRPEYQLLSSTRYDPHLKSYNWNDDQEGPVEFFLLPLHFERLVSAARTHGWTNAESALEHYSTLKSACIDAVSLSLHEQNNNKDVCGTFKVRITISKDGLIGVTATSLPSGFTSDPTNLSLSNPLLYFPRDVTPVRIYIDEEATAPSIFTTTKTTFREAYERAKSRKKIGTSSLTSLLLPEGIPSSDVLLYNPHGEITETTIYNIAFYRDSRWLTPMASTGCLDGVMRRWLVGSGRIYEGAEGMLQKDRIREGEWVLLFNGVQGCRMGKICG